MTSARTDFTYASYPSARDALVSTSIVTALGASLAAGNDESNAEICVATSVPDITAAAPILTSDTKSASGCQLRFVSVCAVRLPSEVSVASSTSTRSVFGSPRSGSV